MISQISLRMDFYDTQTPASSFAVADFIPQVKSQPFMATSNKNHLAISISDIQLYGENIYPTMYSDEVIVRFRSILDFKQYVNNIIEKIRQHQVEIEFNKLQNEPYGFLFIVFSVKSLMLPPPCLYLPDSQVEADVFITEFTKRRSLDNSRYKSVIITGNYKIVLSLWTEARLLLSQPLSLPLLLCSFLQPIFESVSRTNQFQQHTHDEKSQNNRPIPKQHLVDPIL